MNKIDNYLLITKTIKKKKKRKTSGFSFFIELTNDSAFFYKKNIRFKNPVLTAPNATNCHAIVTLKIFQQSTQYCRCIKNIPLYSPDFQLLKFKPYFIMTGASLWLTLLRSPKKIPC